MGKEREIICVLFFPFQIPIYFEFLVLTRYEFTTINHHGGNKDEIDRCIQQ